MSLKPLNCRVAVLGNVSVGKTCIVEWFSTSEFKPDSHPTIGAAFKSFSLPVNEKIVELQVFDCAGNERFNMLLPMYLRGVTSVILVYSVNDPDSRKDILKRWYEFIQNHPITNIYLVENKNDLLVESTSQDFTKSCAALYKQLPDLKQIHAFSTSAKTGSGIKELFSQIAEDCYLRNVDPLPDDIVKPTIVLTKKNSQTKVGSMCCYS